MDTTILVLLIVGGAIFFACPIVGFVLLMLFLLGKDWRRLTEMYAKNQPSGQIIQRQTMKIGAVTYKRCVTVGIATEGLYLTIWRKTVLIPWNEFKVIGQTTLYWKKVPVLSVGNPHIAKITMKNDLFAAMRGRLKV